MNNFKLQKAIDSILSADSTLLNLLGDDSSAGIVANPVVQKPAFPYVVYGNSSSISWDTNSTIGAETTIDIHVFSQSGDQEECATIMERIKNLLHRASPSISGEAVVFLVWDDFDTIEREATESLVTYHGISRFKAVTQAA